ncbi:MULTISPECIES: hypothetical protein [Pseudomonas]|uniref:Uncharacterized protein n=1 Tax=Pseudomonas luteola TaxID=47886 RepID=A0A2X2BV25_PSELU|nr:MULTISPECIES: hypothetical protein [Pseudomonas]SHJ71556.1 hypothetical protein SAMN05216295_12433 [Pseudomonas zeshuii]SPZ00242.1 Uncharacterised protein [Pseudomonas luteola]
MNHVSDHPHFVQLQQGLAEGTSNDWFIRHLMPKAIEMNRHWRTILIETNGELIGLELEHPKLRSYALIMPDPSTPGMYRAQYFDSKGMKAHMTWATPEQVLESLIMAGYVRISRGALERLSVTREWAIGMYKVDLIRRLNAGEICFASAERLLMEFEAQVQSVAAR